VKARVPRASCETPLRRTARSTRNERTCSSCAPARLMPSRTRLALSTLTLPAPQLVLKARTSSAPPRHRPRPHVPTNAQLCSAFVGYVLPGNTDHAMVAMPYQRRDDAAPRHPPRGDMAPHRCPALVVIQSFRPGCARCAMRRDLSDERRRRKSCSRAITRSRLLTSL
jgi:hypothetical protein